MAQGYLLCHSVRSSVEIQFCRLEDGIFQCFSYPSGVLQVALKLAGRRVDVYPSKTDAHLFVIQVSEYEYVPQHASSLSSQLLDSQQDQELDKSVEDSPRTTRGTRTRAQHFSKRESLGERFGRLSEASSAPSVQSRRTQFASFSSFSSNGSASSASSPVLPSHPRRHLFSHSRSALGSPREAHTKRSSNQSHGELSEERATKTQIFLSRKGVSAMASRRLPSGQLSFPLDSVSQAPNSSSNTHPSLLLSLLEEPTSSYSPYVPRNRRNSETSRNAGETEAEGFPYSAMIGNNPKLSPATNTSGLCLPLLTSPEEEGIDAVNEVENREPVKRRRRLVSQHSMVFSTSTRENRDRWVATVRKWRRLGWKEPQTYQALKGYDEISALFAFAKLKKLQFEQINSPLSNAKSSVTSLTRSMTFSPSQSGLRASRSHLMASAASGMHGYYIDTHRYNPAVTPHHLKRDPSFFQCSQEELEQKLASVDHASRYRIRMREQRKTEGKALDVKLQDENGDRLKPREQTNDLFKKRNIFVRAKSEMSVRSEQAEQQRRNIFSALGSSTSVLQRGSGRDMNLGGRAVGKSEINPERPPIFPGIYNVEGRTKTTIVTASTLSVIRSDVRQEPSRSSASTDNNEGEVTNLSALDLVQRPLLEKKASSLTSEVFLTPREEPESEDGDEEMPTSLEWVKNSLQQPDLSSKTSEEKVTSHFGDTSGALVVPRRRNISQRAKSNEYESRAQSLDDDEADEEDSHKVVSGSLKVTTLLPCPSYDEAKEDEYDYLSAFLRKSQGSVSSSITLRSRSAEEGFFRHSPDSRDRKRKNRNNRGDDGSDKEVEKEKWTQALGRSLSMMGVKLREIAHAH